MAKCWKNNIANWSDCSSPMNSVTRGTTLTQTNAATLFSLQVVKYI